jgi:hypothetical protein
MSDDREEPLRGDRSGKAGAWKDFASSALLVTAVGGILIAGFILKVDRGSAAGRTEQEAEAAPPASIVLGTTVAPDPAPAVPTPSPSPAPTVELPLAAAPSTPPAPPAPAADADAGDPLFEKLAVRAAGDLPRLAAARGPWTAQLMVACRVATVDRVVTSARGAAKLYILPAEVHGDACFRVCWGSYASAKDAASAADLPKTLRGKDKIAAVEIAKVAR